MVSDSFFNIFVIMSCIIWNPWLNPSTLKWLPGLDDVVWLVLPDWYKLMWYYLFCVGVLWLHVNSGAVLWWSILCVASSTILDRHVSAADCLVAQNKMYLMSLGSLVVLSCDPMQFWMFVCDTGKFLIHLMGIVIFQNRMTLLGSMTPVVALHTNLKYETHYIHSKVSSCMISLLW
jgi:hypothetical protein